MDSNPTVTLEDFMIEHCWSFAERIVARYASGLSEASRAVSYRGAEANESLWALARMAECAFCFWAQIDPETNLKWSLAPDRGFDVRLGKWLIDIKHTANGTRLIWPLRKNHLFEEKNFNVLALVRGHEPTFEIVGVVSKKRFAHERQVAGITDRLDIGTWFMDEANLVEAEVLRA